MQPWTRDRIENPQVSFPRLAITPDERAAAGDAPSVSSKSLPPIDSRIDDSGTDNSDGIIDSSRSDDSKDQKMTSGWAERFNSEPEVQMQLLHEVERLVRAAARAGGRGESKGKGKLEEVHIEYIDLDSSCLTWSTTTRNG